MLPIAIAGLHKYSPVQKTIFIRVASTVWQFLRRPTRRVTLGSNLVSASMKGRWHNQAPLHRGVRPVVLALKRPTRTGPEGQKSRSEPKARARNWHWINLRLWSCTGLESTWVAAFNDFSEMKKNCRELLRKHLFNNQRLSFFSLCLSRQ